MNLTNLILNTDSYKLSHHLQYPADTDAISAYVTTRGISNRPEVVFFGLQMFLKEYLGRPITAADIAEAEEIAKLHGQPFNRDGWQHILNTFGGYLPLRIEALPEGSVIRRDVPLVQVSNTDAQSAWLTGYIETALLRAIWYPSTVASLARRHREAIMPFLEKTCGDPRAIAWSRLIDFGARGATSLEQAGLGGAAHLTHFSESDTLAGILYARRYYGAEMAGHSIPASEHTTMTAWRQDQEVLSFSTLIDRLAPFGAFSVVSDSYDIHNAVAEILGKTLQPKLRASGATLYVRPDSGDPIDTSVQVVAQLAYAFGTRLNEKGYKVLDDRVRVIQADGPSIQDITMILGRLEGMGFSAENISFGMGTAILQRLSRDTFSFTMKASARRDSAGRWHDMSRRPAHLREQLPPAGRQAVVMELNQYVGVPLAELGARENLLQPVFEDGQILKEWDFDEIRERASA